MCASVEIRWSGVSMALWHDYRDAGMLEKHLNEAV